MCDEAGAWGSRSPQAIFDQLHKLIDGLGGEEIDSRPAEALGDHIKALERIGNRIDAESSRRLRHFDRHQGYSASGALTAQAWLRWQCRLTAASASERVQVARRLACMPMASESFAQGDISHRHAVVIGETASQLGDNFDAIAEATMVDSAKENDPWWLRR